MLSVNLHLLVSFANLRNKFIIECHLVYKKLKGGSINYHRKVFCMLDS